MWENLVFFNKEGINLNFEYDSTTESYTGLIYLDHISTDLYSNQHLFILERLYDTNNTVEVLGTPQNLISQNYSFRFSWSSTITETIFQYNRAVIDNIPTFEKVSSQSLVLDENNFYTTLNVDELKEVTIFEQKPVTVNIGGTSEDEGIFERVLLIDVVDENGTLISKLGEITFTFEVEGEDERLEILLRNLGLSVPEQDFFIFKDVDISESKPDWKIINYKRKELLLEGHNIKDYKAAYKGLINAIKYFGFDDVIVKEYWKNIDPNSKTFEQYKLVELINIFDQAINVNTSNELITNKRFKKTSLFSLSYRINEIIEGEFNEDGIPLVQDITQYTNDEILTKLSGLKRKLKREYLPTNARIVDIVGEGDYFGRNELNIWNDQHNITKLFLGINISYTVSEDLIQIVDLRPVQETWLESAPRDITGDGQSVSQPSWNDPDINTNDLDGHYAGYFEYFNYQDITELNSKDGIPVGAPVTLTNTSFNFTWDDADITWDQLADGSNTSGVLTWDTISYGIYWEAEWEITKQVTTDSPQEWSLTNYDYVYNNEQIQVILPYVGRYDLKLTLIDSTNDRTSKIDLGIMEAFLPEVEIIGYYHGWEKELNWNDISDTWDSVNSTWDLIFKSNTAIEDAVISWDSLNKSNYIDTNTWIDFDVYKWDDMNITWDEMDWIWWDGLTVGSDSPGFFEITDVTNGGIITINGVSHELTTTANATDFNAAADELNDSTSEHISDFVYKAVLDVNDIPQKIHAVLMYSNPENDKIIDASNGAVVTSDYPVGDGTFETRSINLDHDWNEIQIFSQTKEIPFYSTVFFTYDNCKIAGKVNPIWNLTHIPTGTVTTFNLRWFAHLFILKGNYNLTLQLEDTNGNINTVTKYEFISV